MADGWSVTEIKTERARGAAVNPWEGGGTYSNWGSQVQKLQKDKKGNHEKGLMIAVSALYYMSFLSSWKLENVYLSAHLKLSLDLYFSLASLWEEVIYNISSESL